jgi:hypothetical protein
VPTVVEFQEGFLWPHFVLDDCLIGLAGLVPLPPHPRFNIYRPSLGLWTVVSLGHVVEVTESNRVFVKSMDVRHCKNVTEDTITLTPQFRGRLDVTRERVYARQCPLHDEFSNLSPSTSSIQITPKRKPRYDDELSASLRRTRHRLSVLSPDASESGTQIRPPSWDEFAHQEPYTSSTNTAEHRLSDSEFESSCPAPQRSICLAL